MSKLMINQAILARDIIDMAREYKDDSNVMGYISNFCFQIGQITEEAGIVDKDINWTDIFNYSDQKYYNLSNKNTSEIDESAVNKIYDYIVNEVNLSHKGTKMDKNKRKKIIANLKSQSDLYQKNPQNGEEIAYQIAGMVSDESIRSLLPDDPISKIMDIAGELELPTEHRTADATWEKISELIEQL